MGHMRGSRRCSIIGLAIALELLTGNHQAIAADSAGTRSLWAEIPGLEVSKIEDNSKSAPTAILICLHDAYLHRGAFTFLSSKLAKQRVVSYLPDLRGFGRWRRNGVQVNLEQSLSDLEQIVVFAGRNNPNLPIFLLGEGLGAMLALKYAQEHKGIDGLILSSPGCPQDSFLKHTGQNYLLKAATNFPQVKKVVDSDRFITTRLSKSEISNIRTLNEEMLHRNKLSEAPVAIFIGKNDSVTKPENIELVASRLSGIATVYPEDSGRLIFEYLEASKNWNVPLSKPARDLLDWISDRTKPSL